jgi:hypothetical protein
VLCVAAPLIRLRRHERARRGPTLKGGSVSPQSVRCRGGSARRQGSSIGPIGSSFAVKTFRYDRVYKARAGLMLCGESDEPGARRRGIRGMSGPKTVGGSTAAR